MPDKDLELKAPHPSWPVPAGLTVRFQEEKKPAHVVESQSDAKGMVTSPDLEPPGSYKVEVNPGAELALWTCDPDPLKLDTGTAKRQLVKLIPPRGHRLLPLLLRGEDSDGRTVPLSGAPVKVRTPDGRWEEPFSATDDGHIYALVPHAHGAVEVQFKKATVAGKEFAPPDKSVTFEMPKPTGELVDVPTIVYSLETRPAGARGISIEPTIKMLSGVSVPLTGATVTAECRTASGNTVSHSRTLATDEKLVQFPNLDPGVYTIKVTSPQIFSGWPIDVKEISVGPHYLQTGGNFKKKVRFNFKTNEISGSVRAPEGRPLDQPLQLEIYGPDGSAPVTAKNGTFTAIVPSSAPLRIRLAPGPAPTLGGIPLEMSPAEQDVATPPQATPVTLQFKHAIKGHAVDEQGQEIPGAVIVLFQGNQAVATAIATDRGFFTAGVPVAGDYDLAFQTDGGEPVTRHRVSVASVDGVGDMAFRRRHPGRQWLGTQPGSARRYQLSD